MGATTETEGMLTTCRIDNGNRAKIQLVEFDSGPVRVRTLEEWIKMRYIIARVLSLK